MRLFCQRASQEPCGNQIRSTETWLINIHQLVLYITYHSIHNNTHLVVVGTVGGLLDRGVLLTVAHGDADHGVHVDAGQVARLDDCDADLLTMWSPSPATVPVQPYLIILSSQTAEILPTPTSSAAKINSYFTKQYFCYEAIIPGSLHFFPLPLGFSLHLCLCFIFHIEADQTLGPASGHEAAGRGPDVRHLDSSSASSSSCSESVLLAVSQSPSVTLSD